MKKKRRRTGGRTFPACPKRPKQSGGGFRKPFGGSGPLAPVAVFGYRRPDHLRRVLDALQSDPLAAHTRVEIFLDGPKSFWDTIRTWRVRQAARQPRRFASLRIHRAPINRGLARSLTGGVGKVLRQSETVIVLEDDIVPRPGFLSFMNKALARYRHHSKVMQVSGYAYPVAGARGKHTFLPLTSCWGWGTWRRAWRHYGLKRHQATRDLVSPAFRQRMDLRGTYPYSRLLQEVLEGKSDSWGVVWYWNLLKRGGLSLFPGRSYVENVGWDGSGVHGDRRGFRGSGPSVWPGPAATRWPSRVQCDRRALKEVTALFCRRFPGACRSAPSRRG